MKSTVAGVCLFLIASNAALSLAADGPSASNTAPKLIITKAVYGDLPNGSSTDVTEKVAGMLKEGSLFVDATNDNFGDPAEGVEKKLKVDYTIDGKGGSKTVKENETMAITALAGESGKLVILKAAYGDLPEGAATDVTKKVAEAVKDNALAIEASNDNFGDPAEGVVKKLRVDYINDGSPGRVTVGEGETLKIDAPVPASAKLVITKAVYGDLPDGASSDVTKKVQEMVKSNSLTVEASNDNFGDPAEGVGKKLKVEYTMGGKADSKTVNENETLTIEVPAKAADTK